MSELFVILLIVVAIVVIAWNVIPAARERMRGWSTMIEAAIAAMLPFVGNAIDAFQETHWKTYVSQDTWPYVIAGLAGWFILKRVITTTPVRVSK